MQQPQPDIREILTTDTVALTTEPTDKHDCIETLLDLVVETGRVDDRDAALDALLAREEETTTGVGKGIGIPHAKTDAVSEPTLAFLRSEAGIDFDAMDGEPAHLIFMILVPESGSQDHLSILSSLSRALMHDDVREALYDAESPDKVVDVVVEAVE
ncbi:PTS sugar transporter subunit IIA [Haloarchaeobius sp. HME9146]|uniref:PTS sugar transporter subunit IIA n=1 Tax=Haloarchaeobius sp. HME9146 TaxID=2978732 RepID=UPI0021BEF632|nr:fructose PTS transporter subunit IIA [Haloarchaeobius sp. HME9146]MCT9097062.1 fructose PTS transporter subunit IIA [Haloarchaeobius sp. HME9146]